MSQSERVIESDVVIAGSGPGGGSMAWELSRLKKKVVLCEAGKYQRSLGNPIAAASMLDKGPWATTKEGMGLAVGKTVGGSSVMFCASVYKPPPSFKAKTGIDLETEINEVYADFQVKPLPEALIGPGINRIMDSARELGLDWNLTDKWIHPEKCSLGCGKCSYGCPTGAKVTARTYVDQAVENVARLLTQTSVEKVITKSGKAVGVRANDKEGEIDIHAETVVISAGGIGTPLILQRSGIYDAGSTFFVDPVNIVYGLGPNEGNMKDIPMAAGTYLEDEGILLVDCSRPFLAAAQQMYFSGRKGWSFMKKAVHFGRIFSLFAKVKDNLEGRINPDGTVSKTFDADTLNRIKKGVTMAVEILVKAGVKREDIFINRPYGGHLGGTAAIGDIVDEICETDIKGCYCLDTSIIPEAWGLPMSATIIGMGKRLSRHLYPS
jgi:choline dehydrogenase-like flavoprotein